MGKHFYQVASDGTVIPQYDVTDAVARDMGYRPSVTTVKSDILVNHGLKLWAEGQLIKACERSPRFNGEQDRQYFARVRNISYEKRDAAATAGTDFHDLIERYLKGETVVADGEWRGPAFEAWKKWYHYNFSECISQELMLHCPDTGTAGKMDYEGIHKQHGHCVADWKGVDSKGANFTASKFYPEWCMQLAVYERMLRRKKGYAQPLTCISVVFPRDRVSEPFHRVWTREELDESYKLYLCLAWAWSHQAKHWPVGKWELNYSKAT